MMKKLLLAAGLAFALACAGPALASPTFDKEAKALSIDKAHQAEASAAQDLTPNRASLAAIDKVELAAEESGKPKDRAKRAKSGTAVAAQQRNRPLLL